MKNDTITICGFDFIYPDADFSEFVNICSSVSKDEQNVADCVKTLMKKFHSHKMKLKNFRVKNASNNRIEFFFDEEELPMKLMCGQTLGVLHSMARYVAGKSDDNRNSGFAELTSKFVSAENVKKQFDSFFGKVA